MARPRDGSYWTPQSLTIPPDSWRAWVRLMLWEFWMGMLVYTAISFGAYLIAAAPGRIVTVFDFSNCYAVPLVVQPCERVAYRAGALDAVLNFWFGLLLIGGAVWLLGQLWNAAAPKPITDDFLKLLDDSFGRDWRKPRTWPWARMAWAYGFALVAACVGLAVSAALSSMPTQAPAAHVDTSQRFRSSE